MKHQTMKPQTIKPNVQTIGLKSARHALGWSQHQLAERSGISRVTIARLEAGDYSPKVTTIQALLAAVSQAGIELDLDHPLGGFQMVVSSEAISARNSAASA